MIIKALADEQLPIYGDGQNIRDWLFVEDHASALALVAERGAIGETYNIAVAASAQILKLSRQFVLCSIEWNARR